MTLVQRLRARGCTFALTGNRLRVSPWRVLTSEEQAALREHRDAIKTLIRAGLPDAPPVTATTTATENPCVYCGQSPCIGSAHPAYSTLHYMDPEEVSRRAKEATAVMMRTIGRRY